MFDTTKPVQIETDVLDLAIGVYIIQKHNSYRHLIAYYSRKMIALE